MPAEVVLWVAKLMNYRLCWAEIELTAKVESGNASLNAELRQYIRLAQDPLNGAAPLWICGCDDL